MESNLIAQLSEAFHYSFMQRALVAGTFVACSCGVLGVFLVLRRFSMIGDGLAHFSFGAIGLALLLGIWPFYVAVPLVVAASFLVLRLSERAVHGDAAIGMLSAVGVASGVMLATLGGGFNVDLFSYLFGDILAVSGIETGGAVVLSLLVLGVTVLYYNDLFAVTFDPENARVLGVRARRVESVLVFVAAITVVLGIKVVGTMLVSSLIIFPAVTALQVAKGFKSALVLAAGQGIVSVLLGVSAAYILDVPAGAMIVTLNAVIFGLAFCLARFFRM